jgi:peptidoglycan/LPS O-acetylase OafA/YrhL
MTVEKLGERAPMAAHAGAAPRLPELDSLRGIAALGVVLWHYSGMFRQQPLAGPLAPFYLSGGLLVDFFFVLSGFVLGRTYDTAARRGQLGRNLWQRVARLYPLHFVTLLAVLACDLANAWLYGQPPREHNDAYHFALNLLLLQSSGLQQDYSFNGPSWSVSTEFLTNVLFLALVARMGRPGRWLMAMLAAAAAALLLKVGILDQGVPVSGRYGVLDLSLVRGWFGFFVGTLCYRLYRRRDDGRPLPASVRATCDVAGLALLLGIGAYMARWLPQSHGGDVLLGALAFPALILAAAGGGWLRRALRWRPLTYLGEISYSVYLVHFPLILAILTAAGPGERLPVGSPWFLLAFYALVVLVASATYRAVELPGKRWLSGWLPARRDAGARRRRKAPRFGVRRQPARKPARDSGAAR